MQRLKRLQNPVRKHIIESLKCELSRRNNDIAWFQFVFQTTHAVFRNAASSLTNTMENEAQKNVISYS